MPGVQRNDEWRCTSLSEDGERLYRGSCGGNISYDPNAFYFSFVATLAWGHFVAAIKGSSFSFLDSTRSLQGLLHQLVCLDLQQNLLFTSQEG